MDSTHKLHPLIATAAVSLIVLSAAGVGALSGVLPISAGKPAEASAPVVQSAPAAVAPVAPVAPVVIQVPAPAPAAPAAAPAPKPAKRSVVRTSAPRPAEPARAYEEPWYRGSEFEAPPVTAQAPRFDPQSLPTPAPVPTDLGTVQSVREIAQAGEGSGLGAVAGGVAGAVIGNQFGHGNGKKIMTILGAAGGAYGGHQIEKNVRGSRRWEITVRFDDGAYRTVSTEIEPLWRSGDRVRLVNGALQSA